MAGTAKGATGLSYVVAIPVLVLGFGAFCHADCEAEAAALASAEIDYEDADLLYMHFLNEWTIDPTPANAAALAAAEIDRDDAIILRDMFADEFAECLANVPPPMTQPIPAVPSSEPMAETDSATEVLTGYSVLVAE